MRLYDEIFKSVDGAATARFVVACGGGGYFEGVKAVGDFSDENVVLYFPRHSLLVEGKDLTIKKYCDGDLELAGKISAVRLLQSENDEKPAASPARG